MDKAPPTEEEKGFLTMEELKPYFVYPFDIATSMLNLSRPKLKANMVHLGISRWPYHYKTNGIGVQDGKFKNLYGPVEHVKKGKKMKQKEPKAKKEEKATRILPSFQEFLKDVENQKK
eukprot:gene52-4302_t